MRKLAALLALTLVVALPDAAPAAKKRPRLKAFSSCASLLSYARGHAARTVGHMFVGRPVGGPVMGGAEDGGGPAPASPQPQAAPQRDTGEDFSTTNVQEQGVDEPDVVKTDGRTLFTIAAGRLHAVDVRSEQPRVLGSLDLPDSWGHELLLHGSTLLVVSQGMRVRDGVARSVTRLVEVDAADPSQMRVRRTQEADGAYVTGRLNGETARIVVTSPPRVFEDLPFPEGSRAQVLRAQRRVVRRAGLRGFLPRARYHDRISGRRHTRRLASCGRVRRPSSFSGLDTLAVLTVDMEKGLPISDSDAVMTSAEIVYGGTRDLFVATQRYLPPAIDSASELPPRLTTAIHRFDSSERGVTHYRASGEVEGFLLSQWAMSEHRGRLRVASTNLPAWMAGDVSESAVSVLDERDGRLVKVGSVGGLGRGERIYAVRFMGDVGYVVTFRQVDPLYTIDLSDPERPRVRGELKIEGYSAYLHPVGEGLLLGVGQDATPEGRVKGTQLSLFDVSDLSSPRRIHQHALGTDSHSSVEFDHRAFLWWGPTDLAVIPLQIHSRDGAPFTGAAGFRVDAAAGIAEVGRARHPGEPYLSMIHRSAVVGDRLFTVSQAGVLASRLDTFADAGFAAFAPSQ